MAKLNMQRIHDALAKSRDVANATVSVIKAAPLNGGQASRVTLSLSQPLNADQAAVAIQNSTDGNVALVRGTFRPVPGRGAYHLATAIVVKAEKSRPLADTASMVKMSSSQFKDEAGHIWSVSGQGDDRRIVFQESEDLSDILEARKVRLGIVQPRDAAPAALGDFASVLDSKNRVVTGYVFPCGDVAHVMNPELSAPFTVPTDNIIATVSPRHVSAKATIDLSVALTSANTLDMTALWAYLKKAWAHAPEMVERLKQQVRGG